MPTLTRIKNYVLSIKSKNTKYILHTTNYCKTAGFTLIELLIVITVLGILSAAVSRNFIAAQQRSRDAVRKSDLAQIKKSLELAKQDCSGSSWYPVVSGNNESQRFTNLRTYLSDTDLKYMPNVPNDPRGGSYRYNIWTSGSTFQADVCLDSATPPSRTQDGSLDYMLRAPLERGTSDPDAAATYAKCAGKPGMPANPPGSQGMFYVCNE